MRGLLLLALGLAACRSGGEPARAPGWDAAAWVRQTSAEWDRDLSDGEPLPHQDAAWDARARLHADSLNRHVAWKTACDERWGEAGYQSPFRGQMQLHPLPGGEALVLVTCDFGAYQGAFALVHIAGPEAAVVRAPTVLGGALGAETAVFAGFVGFEALGDGRDLAAERRFLVFARARGLGDCGALTTYRLGGLGRAEPETVRARDCEGDPALAPPPEAWPVVYPAP